MLSLTKDAGTASTTGQARKIALNTGVILRA